MKTDIFADNEGKGEW